MNNDRGSETNRKGELRIDELFSEIFETETVNIQDGSDLLQEGLSKEEKERILKIALDKIGPDIQAEDRIRKVMPVVKIKKRILAVALIAIFAFATTAFAAEVFQWDVRISNYLGIENHNSDSLEGGGMNVGVSDENGGITIQAVQTIGDGTNIYILFDVTAPEGKTIYPGSSFDMVYLHVGNALDGPTGMGYSCNMVDDDQPNDNKATFLLSMDANKKINDKNISVKFENLRHYVTGSGEMITDCPGDWNLKWKLDYKDISTKYNVGKDLTVKDGTVHVDAISISPIALNVEASGSYIREYDSAPKGPQEKELIGVTAITLKDGTVLTQEDASSWGTSINGNKYVLNMQMKKLLDVDQVKSISLNGTEFVLK
jgi:hypothetical protein